MTPLGTKMSDALLIMTNKSLGTIGVLDGKGALSGIICDGDLRRHMSSDLMNKKVDEVMPAYPKTVPADMLEAEG